MNTMEAVFRIVTPMFIGGADQSPSDGIRPPSVKGALRFWWRALNWKHFRENNDSDEAALKALHGEEARLFGGTAEQGGQGCFLLTVRHNRLTSKAAPAVHEAFESKDAARYLGYGLMVAYGSRNQNPPTCAGQLIRSCIDENQTFTVALAARNQIDDSILDALKALGLLGGLGSRSRHGMGSLALEKIVCDGKDIWAAPMTQEQYQAEIKALLAALGSAPQPDYSAFSKDSRLDCLFSANSPYEALNKFGKAMLKYRSWGKNDKVLGEKSEKRFKDDHDWFREEEIFRAANPAFHPKRVVFGLPHNYDSRNKKYIVNAAIHERRASPLFFHVHRLSDKEYLGVSLLLQSRFLPNVEKINAGGHPVDQHIDWKVITNFLDGKVGDTSATPNPTAPARFPDKKAVLP
ncbi:MAG: type III-B CRISPR module RAMP protein Cmr1 [Sulfuricellaceae bacterium]